MELVIQMILYGDAEQDRDAEHVTLVKLIKEVCVYLTFSFRPRSRPLYCIVFAARAEPWEL